MWIKEHKLWISSWWVWIICVFCGALGSIPQQKCAGTQIVLDVFAMEVSGIILLFYTSFNFGKI